MDFVDVPNANRCEFAPGDESEACMVSSAFIPQVRYALLVVYNISSPDTVVELMIVSRFTEQVMQSHSFSQQQIFFITFIPITVEPMYVVLCAHPGVSTSTSSSTSVTIMTSLLSPFNDS